MDQINDKYAILHDKDIMATFSDPVEAIRINRTKHPIGSKVVRIEADGSHVLLAQNKRILQNGRTVNRKVYKNNGLFTNGMSLKDSEEEDQKS